jgi:hypothetical protein
VSKENLKTKVDEAEKKVVALKMKGKKEKTDYQNLLGSFWKLLFNSEN